MNYSHVLLPAHTSSDAVERLELVATFAVSALASNLDRFVSSLASNLDRLVSSLAWNLDRLVSALASNLDRLFSSLARNLDMFVLFLASNLDRLVSSLASNLDRLVSALARNLDRLVSSLNKLKHNVNMLFSRMGKPFNPLLGETYQLEQEHFRFVCEQVFVPGIVILLKYQWNCRI